MDKNIISILNAKILLVSYLPLCHAGVKTCLDCLSAVRGRESIHVDKNDLHMGESIQDYSCIQDFEADFP